MRNRFNVLDKQSRFIAFGNAIFVLKKNQSISSNINDKSFNILNQIKRNDMQL